VFTFFVRVSLLVVCLIALGTLLVGCSTQKHIRQENLSRVAVPALAGEIDVMSKNHVIHQFERIPFIITDNMKPKSDYIHKLLVQLDNGQVHVIILEDNENINQLTTNLLNH
jgi:hypothetical protein